MSEQALIFEVGESGFDRYVIENSHKVPVLAENAPEQAQAYRRRLASLLNE